MWSSTHLSQKKKKKRKSPHKPQVRLQDVEGTDRTRSSLIKDQYLLSFLSWLNPKPPPFTVSLSASRYIWPPAFLPVSLHLIWPIPIPILKKILPPKDTWFGPKTFLTCSLQGTIISFNLNNNFKLKEVASVFPKQFNSAFDFWSSFHPCLRCVSGVTHV